MDFGGKSVGWGRLAALSIIQAILSKINPKLVIKKYVLYE